jgi:hypothetical protein
VSVGNLLISSVCRNCIRRLWIFILNH